MYHLSFSVSDVHHNTADILSYYLDVERVVEEVEAAHEGDLVGPPNMQVREGAGERPH